MEKKIKIMRELENKKQYLIEYGFNENNIIGIFLYGSQNYNLDTPTSDWDTKAIIVPTFDEVLFDRPLSKEIDVQRIEGEWEHCEVKDIREMVNMFKKQNINFIEILYTQYKWINPTYLNLWNKYFVDNPDMIMGNMEMISTRFGYDSACIANEEQDLEKAKDIYFQKEAG